MTDRRDRILLVGAGRRVRNNYLPVLHYLADLFEVVGIQSPNPERRVPLAEQWGVASYARIEDVPLGDIDVVAISVPTPNNADVLQSLLPHAARLTIVIDTPVSRTLKELAAALPLASQFKRVVIAEDYMNFPRYELMRDAVKMGLVGRPASITLNSVGYAFHGLALIRSFAGFKKVRASKRLQISSKNYALRYKFDSFFGSVIGPYRGDTAGGVVLSGDGGTITEFPRDVTDNGAGTSFLLQPVRTDGEISGFAIEAGQRSMAKDLPILAAMRAMDFPDKSTLNLERGCGLATVFRSLSNGGTINDGYGLDEAFYDSFTAKMVGRGKLPYDPFATAGLSYLDAVKQYARLRHG